MNRFLIVCFLLSLPVQTHARSTIGVKSLEQAFAISSVLTDSDALTFGVANFDLNYFTGSGFGDEDTLALKKNINILVLPYRWQLAPLDKNREHAFELRASYIEVQRDSEPLQGFTNFEHEYVFGLLGQYSQHFQLSENWHIGLSLGSHLMYYKNKYSYSEGFPEALKLLLDGYIFNTSATVLIAEPTAKFSYKKEKQWGQWKLHNGTHYLIGQGIGGEVKNISDVNPEGWRVTNGIELQFDLPNLWGVSDHIVVDFKRIDIGGDMTGLSSNGYYFETSIGWVIDTKNKIPLLDNVGIGININYGSSLSGGTIVFYYNE